MFLYSNAPAEDAETARFRTLTPQWRSIAGVPDEAAAEQIRRDGIDILVDMAGHTAGNRLLVFARRPAPVQVEYMLGHGTTSGLNAMDAFMADDALATPYAAAVFTEQLVRLPRIPMTYKPPAGMPPPGPLPALANGCVTFGYFGRPERLTPGTVAAWSRILTAVPGARLFLNTAALGEAAYRELIAQRFARHGIGHDRLILRYTTPQSATWAAYGAVDIALDPFPHNAGTTTVEALWQGVPVVSKADRPGVGRLGASILGAAGLPEWVTATVDDYVRLAVQQAADLPALARLRSSLRDRIAASPLCDAASLARAVEDAYRDLWRAWCATATVPVAAT